MRKFFSDYLKNNSNEFQVIFFKFILNNLDSIKQYDLLEKIIIKYPNWDISNLNIDLFNDKYIECFGIDFLTDNIRDVKKLYLEFGIKDEYIKERMLLIHKLGISFDNINSKFLLSTIMNNDDIIKISKLLKNNLFANFICNHCIDDKEYFDIILKATNQKSHYYKLINILLNRFDQKEYDKFKKILYKKNICEYINFFKNIETSWFDINSDLEKYLKIFEQNKILFNQIQDSNKNLKNNLKIYFYDDLVDVNSIDELNNIRTIRYEKIKKIINNSNNTHKVKTLITKCYFNLEYDVFENKIKDIKVLINEGFKLNNRDMKIFNILETFIDTNNKNLLINIFDKLINITEIYEYIDKLEKKQREYCFNDIATSLTNVGKGYEIIEFNGQDFNFLIHKIKGYANRDFANKLYEDPSLWNNNYVENSYISTSMITNDYLGCVSGTGYILAFNNIDGSLINDMGPEDIYYSIRKRKGKNSKVMTQKKLIKNSKKIYNEIVLKRYNNKKATMPSAVIVFDTVTEKSISVAKYFNVPIYLINREKYLEKMIQKCNDYLENSDYENYCNQRIKIALSFNDDHRIMEKYFSNNKLNENTNIIIDKIISEIKKSNNNKEKKYLKEQLKNMISVNYKINSIMMYNEISYKNYEFNETDIEKKLNLYLNC